MTLNQPHTDDGISAWSVIQACRWQIRVGMAGAYALDLTAVLTMAEAMEAKTALLVEVLPAIEGVLIAGLRKAGDGADDRPEG